jgi:Arc/MetJ family transcription regulator
MVAIDSELIKQALKVSGERTKKAAVARALHEFVARRKQKRLRDLFSKLEWDESISYKREHGRD